MRTDVYPQSGADLIATERQRQIDVEGWTPEHDTAHDTLDLIQAAECYVEAAKAMYSQREGNLRRSLRGVPAEKAEPYIQRTLADPLGTYYGRGDDGQVNPSTTNPRWPWAREDWKPDENPIRNLVKAGALIAAEIDRLAAVAGPSAEEPGG